MQVLWILENIDDIASDLSHFHGCWIDPENDEYLDPFGRQMTYQKMTALVYRVSSYEDSLVRKQYIEDNYDRDEETGELIPKRKVMETGETLPDGTPVLQSQSEFVSKNDLDDFDDYISFV